MRSQKYSYFVRDSGPFHCHTPPQMDLPILLQGRLIHGPDVAQINELLAAHPDWSRYRLSRHLAQLWNWLSPSGKLKDMAARTLLLKLEQRGWISLPSRRWASPNRMRHKQTPALSSSLDQDPIHGSLAYLVPLRLQEVSSGPSSDRALFEALLHRFHYLSYRSPVGENLQYLVREKTGRPVACLLFGAAAWQCADRDRYIGWDAATRAAQLQRVTNNTRFLVMPWINVSCLASHVLGRVVRRVSSDWQRKYGHPVDLLETFVERDRFSGTCYQAANWRNVGQTKGRTRQNAPDGKPFHVPIKDIYLYALHPDFAQRLSTSTPC